MPFKKYLSIIIKIVIVFFSFYFIYHQLVENKSFEELDISVLIDTVKKNKVYLFGVILMMFLNWLVEALKWRYMISKIENIIIAQDACEFILNISNNSIRILVNYLEKLKLLEEEVTIELAMDVCTNISFHLFEKYVNYCYNSELQNAILIVNTILNNGFSVMDVLDNFFLFIKYTKKLDETTKYDVTKLICKYIIIFHDIHEDEIEMGLFTNNLINLFSNSIINVKPNI